MEIKSPAYLDEQRYCINGTRYLPQKSTNFICSTRLSKNTPLHLGLTQQLAFSRQSKSVWGTSAGVTLNSFALTTRAESSNSDGGFSAISWTNRTTSGLSRRLSYRKRGANGEMSINLGWLGHFVIKQKCSKSLTLNFSLSFKRHYSQF